jgi:hypothetical protein
MLLFQTENGSPGDLIRLLYAHHAIAVCCLSVFFTKKQTEVILLQMD